MIDAASNTAKTQKSKNSSKPAPASSAHHYRVEIADLHAHLFHVTLTIARPAALQRVSLPVWIPGSYLVREFSKNLQNLQAHQGGRSPASLAGELAAEQAIEQLDKCTWQIACSPQQPLVLRYQVHAHDNSVPVPAR